MPELIALEAGARRGLQGPGYTPTAEQVAEAHAGLAAWEALATLRQERGWLREWWKHPSLPARAAAVQPPLFGSEPWGQP